MEDVIFLDIWSILYPFYILYSNFEYFVVIWFIFLHVGKLYQ
jgi:hypothetical protein